MKKYVHWLKINCYSDDENLQYYEIQKYLDSYNDAKATIYTYNSGNFNKIIKLECSQCYSDLDMMINSMSNNLERLRQKPNEITVWKEFFIPEYIKN